MAQPISRIIDADVDADSLTDAAGRPWQVYICNACGLLYDEREGDADSGLAPGTRFADIPDDWACPLCGVRKDDFVPYLRIDPSRTAVVSAAPPARGLGPRQAGVVIVGAGHAGWQMVQALRQRDAHLLITLVTGCSGDLYDKPLLSVAHARAIPTERLVRESGVDAATRLNVQLMPMTFATGLSPQSHQLRTTRGSLRYRTLILAQGARPRSIGTLPASLCWRINHLDAYLRLRAHLAAPGLAARHVVIVGAGLVGCELANDLALAGHRITLIDVGAAPLSAWLPAQAVAALMQAWASLPISFIGGVTVASLGAEGTRRILRTTDGLSIVADEVIAATGLEVDRLLADSGGLSWQNGIAVDAATLATSAPDIHALGDCITIDGMASRYIEPIGRQAHAIAGAITGIDLQPYVQRASPLRVKTTSCGLRLDGFPQADGAWQVDALPEEVPAMSSVLRMSQWQNGQLQARLSVG